MSVAAALLALLSFSTADALCPAATQSRHVQPVAARSVVVLRGGGGVATQWGRYLQALEEKPMATKMATAAVLSGTGDLIAQGIEASGPFALRRFLTLVAVNVLCAPPHAIKRFACTPRARSPCIH